LIIFVKKIEAMGKKEVVVSLKQEPVANCDQFPKVPAEERIFTIRGYQVIIDRDLADLYGVDTKRLNEQVRRNEERFPPSFRFQLSKYEIAELVAKCDRLNPLKHSSNPPFAFTEQGVAMLSAVLRSPTAIKVSIGIMEAFVTMRRFLVSNAQVFQRLDRIEYKLLESDHMFEDIYSKLEEKSLEPEQGIFFDGQIYDSYVFITSLIKTAKRRIILIDNYVDDSILTMLDKREPGVDASIHTLQISKQLKLDIEKHNKQYPPIHVNVFTKAHDRFLIIDDKVYHIGASLKDLGKRWFAFSLMLEVKPDDLVAKL
jgi:hypothetical protein